MFEWVELNEEDERFICDPGFNDETDEDPDFAGMPWIAVQEEIYQYEYELRCYEDEWRRMQDRGF